MALNFPNSPSDGDTWVDPSNGTQYVYVAATTSWRVSGVAGVGTVTSVTINGTNGIVPVSGNPIVDVGTIVLSFNIASLAVLP
ncbi:hypothetical protein SCRM01_015 [Synechococcus phage S-CRM01]|uniref:hypothetical protein n=1 Tax=Synechococcus phage S-CRM01 TaxID=1026955 RepID=UPI000209E339|nr:hypothetical protein SCRM01_015 [Synechococcus phage S-CRM01]AEC52962.1 hypothetical protein SCRM01_015 [Synechococcus phage S-CRM01]